MNALNHKLKNINKNDASKTINKQVRSKLTCIVFILISSMTFAQDKTNIETALQCDGFMFEFSLGGGIISVEDSEGIQTFDRYQGGISFPELKFGYMLNNRLAITAVMPGMIYEFQNNDRHFGGFIPSVQYWIKDKWWIHGGVGLAIDGPALYDIKNINDDWNFGCAVMASTGYEVYRKNKFSMNVQSKLVLGRAYLEGDTYRDAISFSLGLGFNWL